MKKFRSVWMALIIMILSIAVVIGSIGVAAFAATPIAPVTSSIFSGMQKLAEKVVYGDKFDVPASSISNSSIKVTAPNGQPASIVSNKVTADQIGNYTVQYMSDATATAKVLYSFTVNSYLEKEYFIKVDGNGADIPTYIQKGNKFTVPGAILAYYDDKDKLQTVDEQDINISIGGDAVEAGDEYEIKNTGSIYVRYSAKLQGGSKIYTKEFIIKSQNEFKDEAAPKLDAVNIPTSGNINKKVTLPKATATDNFDENIKYDIKVTLEGEDVIEYEIDENGFADNKKPVKKGDKDVKVIFDNDKQMYFYPTVEGTYVISYIAYDDQGNASGTNTEKFVCSDKAAPEFKEINDFTIPSKWSVNAGVVRFPNPTVVDNSLSDKLIVSFKITDTTSSTSGSSNKVTIVEFSNIKGAAGESGTISKIAKYNDGKEVTFKATDDYFEFDFSKYSDVKDGDYSIEYRATDASKAKNSSTKTYKITIDSTFDSEYGAPNTCELETVKYFALAKDESFIVPTPNVKDKQDANLEVDYRIISDIESDNSKYLSVKGGEKINIVKVDTKYYLQLDTKTYTDTDKGLELNSNLYFYVEATNDIGKTIANTSDKKVKSVDNEFSNVVKVINTETITNNFVLTLDSSVTNTAYKINTANLTEPDLKVLSNDNKVINAGGFIISGIGEHYRYFTGFEIAVYDENGKALDNVTLETFSTPAPSNGTSTIYVRNIEFMPSVAGDYRLVISAFDVSGNTSIQSIAFKVVGTLGDKVESSSVNFPEDYKGNINTAYTLPNEKVTITNPVPDKDYYTLRKIKGGKFSIMGSEFIAKSQSSYTFNDGYVAEDAVTDTVGTGSDQTTLPKFTDTYKLSAKSSEKISIEIHDILPQYVDKNSTVLIPYITGSNRNGNAEITVEVADKNGKITVNKIESDDYIKTTDGKISIVKDAAGNDKADALYGHYFTAIADGDYTITVTAKLGEQTDEKKFVIKSGDIINPVIKVEAAPSTRYKIGEKFTFSKVTSEKKATGVEATEFTYTKQLVDVNGNEVASISGTGTKYQEMLDSNGDEIILNKSGTYTVIYKVKDTVGNESILKYEFTVKADSKGSSTSLVALSTVLIIVGVLLLGGLIVYFVRFRKVKK